jgi:hypothetical protein
MRRRDFIQGIAGSAAAWPLAARAQRPKGLVIGYLYSISKEKGPIVSQSVAVCGDALTKHSKARGELDEPTHNLRHDGVSSDILLLTWT